MGVSRDTLAGFVIADVQQTVRKKHVILTKREANMSALTGVKMATVALNV